jgi:hypothetical protein
MNNRQKGNIAESKAVSVLTRKGFEVCIPVHENNKFDLVVVKNNELKTVQVKATENENGHGSYSVNLRTTYNNNSRMTTKNHQDGDYDLLFVLTPDGCYLIPERDFDCVNSLTVSENNKYSEYKIDGSVAEFG